MSKLERFNKLSWEILEHKCRYYIMDSPTIEDYEYDLIEKEYDALADELGLPKSASDMVGFKEDRPSCQRVMTKLIKSKPKKRRKVSQKVLDSIEIEKSDKWPSRMPYNLRKAKPIPT